MSREKEEEDKEKEIKGEGKLDIWDRKEQEETEWWNWKEIKQGGVGRNEEMLEKRNRESRKKDMRRFGERDSRE